MPSSTLLSLFRYKAWADGELLDALAPLDAAQYGEAHHTALRIFNHIHVVDAIFKANLLGEPHGFSATNTPETPPLAALRTAIGAQHGVAAGGGSTAHQKMGINWRWGGGWRGGRGAWVEVPPRDRPARRVERVVRRDGEVRRRRRRQLVHVLRPRPCEEKEWEGVWGVWGALVSRVQGTSTLAHRRGV